MPLPYRRMTRRWVLVRTGIVELLTRSPHGFSMRRLAPSEGPAVPAAGWQLHRGELEPGDEGKASQWLSGRK
jgi:hypothetical protein